MRPANRPWPYIHKAISSPFGGRSSLFLVLNNPANLPIRLSAIYFPQKWMP
ncbi:hypothetical protein [Spirosoma fluminis]